MYDASAVHCRFEYAFGYHGSGAAMSDSPRDWDAHEMAWNDAYGPPNPFPPKPTMEDDAAALQRATEALLVFRHRATPDTDERRWCERMASIALEAAHGIGAESA